MYKLKENIDIKGLKRYGFEQSHVAILPQAMVKVVDENKIIEIRFGEKCVNMWTLKDTNNIGEIWVWDCDVLNISNMPILAEPEVNEHIYYETTKGTRKNDIVEKYITDLIKDNLVIRS